MNLTSRRLASALGKQRRMMGRERRKLQKKQNRASIQIFEMQERSEGDIVREQENQTVQGRREIRPSQTDGTRTQSSNPFPNNSVEKTCILPSFSHLDSSDRTPGHVRNKDPAVKNDDIDGAHKCC